MNLYKKSLQKNKGFTLIELLTVVAIMSVMSAVVVSELQSARMKARDSQRIAQIVQVTRALEMYFDTHSSYPPSNPLAVEDTPQHWASMIETLQANNLISFISEQPKPGKFSKFLSQLTFIKTAQAVVGGPIYIPASIQDPLYQEAEDYLFSYAYIAYNNNRNYKIRIRLEYPGNALLLSSYVGPFIGTDPDTIESCSPAMQYYCIAQ